MRQRRSEILHLQGGVAQLEMVAGALRRKRRREDGGEQEGQGAAGVSQTEVPVTDCPQW